MYTTQKWINLVAFILMVAVNVLANVLPLGGNTSGQVSDLHPTLFTPAGMTFSIWGAIYILLGIVIVWSLFDKSKAGNDIVNSVGMWFAISCALNIVWIFSWHYREYNLSMLIIAVLAMVLYVIMNKVRTNALASSAIGLYTGWITVATIAAIYVTAAANGWNAMSGTASLLIGVGIIAGAAIIAGIVYLTGNNMFAAAAVWAYVGIIVRHTTTLSNHHPVLITLAIVGVIIIGFSSIYSMILNGSIALVRTGNVLLR